MVVDRDREDLLRRLLADHVLVEDLADLVRASAGRTSRPCRPYRPARLLADDVVAELDALVADEHRRAGDQLAAPRAGSCRRTSSREACRRMTILSAIRCCLRRPLLVRSTLRAAQCRFCKTLSTMPYFTRLLGGHEIVALGVALDLSRSAGRCARPGSRSAARAGYRISLAWISMSDAWPWKPPSGWWIMTREFGSAEALALGAGRQQERAHARRHARRTASTRRA